MGVSQTKVFGRSGEHAGPLLERGPELEALARAMDRLEEGTGSLLLIEGPAGIGKTRLLAEAVGLARRRNLLVRAARGGELERGMPFGLARQLLESVLERSSPEERERLLTGSAGLALLAFGGADPESDPAGDPLAPIHGLYWLVANLADTQSLVLAIDDAHWGDAQTLRFLDYLTRRLADLPVLVIACVRSGEPNEPPELEPLRPEAELIRPEPLTSPAVAELIAAELGGDPNADLSEACAEATAGNPFLLVELVRALRADAIVPDAENAAAAIAGLGPDGVARQVLLRLGRFGEDAIAFVRAIAVLGGSPQLRHAAKLGGLHEDRARELCDRLREAEILAPGLPLDFVHPLIRSAIYRDLSEEKRSSTHRRAAEVLRESGTAVREIAPHLMACTPNGDQWVVAQLREAAGEAMAAGAHDSAGSYLQRALAEPPDEEVPVLYGLGRALLESDPFRAPPILSDVALQASDPELRIEALRWLALAYLHTGNLEQAARTTAEALQALPESDREQALALEAQLFGFSLGAGRADASASKRIQSVAAGLKGTTAAERLARQALSVDRFNACDPVDEVVELAGSFPAAPWEVAGVTVVIPSFAAKVLAYSGRWELAREALMGWTEVAHQSGRLLGLSYGYGFLAEIDRLGGLLNDAEAEARTAWEIAGALGRFSIFGWSAFMNLLATVIVRGDLNGAMGLTDGFDLSAGPREVPMNPWPVEMRGYLRLARGDLEAGVEDLLVLGENLEGLGYRNPAISPWRQEAAPALAALGRTGEAEELLALGEERARTFGAPHVIGTFLRARALLEPRKRQVDALRESVALLQRAGPPHELARSLVELGAALRRDGQRREAREPLRGGLELAHRCGADGLERKAREELAAVGSRPRSAVRTGIASLTASELRIARLAAEGLNNREIAERLFITRRTVEAHLTHAYGKLEISGRRDLRAALADDQALAH